MSKDLKTFEAGLATSAAPFYLIPFKKGANDYVDGAVYANCPAKVALDEKGKLWPNEGTSLDILLSLGTGLQPRGKPKIPKLLKYGFFKPILKMFERQMDTEETWEDLESNSLPATQARLHRLNPSIQGDQGGYVEIFHFLEIDNLSRQANAWAEENASCIRHIGNLLIAGLFFFEPDPETTSDDGMKLSGSVRCRLQHESETLRALFTTRVQGFWCAAVTKAEVLQLGSLPDGRWQSIRYRSGSTGSIPTVEDADGTKKFRLACSLDDNHQDGTYHVIAVQLTNEATKLPISGFPATLSDLNERSKSLWLQ